MRSDKESFFFLGSVILLLINPAPDYNTPAHSGPVSYLPSINFKLLSITRYNETRNFITSHGPISATNCFSIHFQNPSISQGVGVKISHAQKDRRIQEVREEGEEGEAERFLARPVYLLFIGSVVNRAGELVRITFKGQEPEALTDT